MRMSLTVVNATETVDSASPANADSHADFRNVAYRLLA